MSKPKPPAFEPVKAVIYLFQWARHFAAEAAGAIAAYLILPTLVLIGVLLIGCLLNDAPIVPLCLLVTLFAVFVPLILVKCYRVIRRMRQVDRASNSISETSNALIRELSGSYTPYVVEAAEKLGSSGEPAVSSSLLLVLEQAVAEQRPGWEDVAAALIEALGNVGDARALSVLDSLQGVQGVCNLPSLAIAIEQLTVAASHAQLLRPIDYFIDPAAKSALLRPAAELDTDARTSLMRALKH